MINTLVGVSELERTSMRIVLYSVTEILFYIHLCYVESEQ